MGAPGYSGTIEFPARFIDTEIKELLAKQYEVRFKEPDPRELEPELELEETVYGEIEVKIVDGVFFFHDGEARYGEFYELEELLVAKGVPFDRESGMDWNAPPAIRIFRPGPPVFDHTDSTPDGYDEVVSVSKIREIIKGKLEDGKEVGLAAYKKIINLMAHLDEAFPAYPPLKHFVNEEGAP